MSRSSPNREVNKGRGTQINLTLSTHKMVHRMHVTIVRIGRTNPRQKNSMNIGYSNRHKNKLDYNH